MNCVLDGLVVEILKAAHVAIEVYARERAAGKMPGMAEGDACKAAAESFIREWRAQLADSRHGLVEPGG